MRLAPAALAIAAMAATTAPAYAAKALTCRTVNDADAGTESSMDVHWAKVTFGPKTVTAVLALDRTSTKGEPVAMAGARWTVSMQLAGTTYAFQRRRSTGSNETYRYEMSGGPRGTISPNVVETPTTIRWTIPRGAVDPRPKLACTVSASSAYGVAVVDTAGPQHR